MRDYYIPDLTERFPEGLDGVDMFEPYDIETKMWDDLEREYRESERANIEQINRAGFEIIKQDDNGWTLAKSGGDLILFTINPKSGEIESIYDRAKDRPENRASMLESWQEITQEH